MHCDLLRLRNFNPNRMLVSRGVASILIRCFKYALHAFIWKSFHVGVASFSDIIQCHFRALCCFRVFRLPFRLPA